MLAELLNQKPLRKVQTKEPSPPPSPIFTPLPLYNIFNFFNLPLDLQGSLPLDFWTKISKDKAVKLILVDFFAYSCTNCLRTVPVLKNWIEKYAKLGLRVMAFHRPEFEFEKSPINILKFLLKEKIEYPVALDNLDQAWLDWKVEFWPQHFLIAPQPNGEFRMIHTHYGDRNHHEMEQEIYNRLCPTKLTLSPVNHDEWKDMEVFLGRSHRRKNIASECGDGVCKFPIISVSVPEPDHRMDRLEYKKGITNGNVKFESAQWITSKEYIQAATDQAQLELDFTIEGLTGENLSIYVVAEPPELEGYKETPIEHDGASPVHLSFIDTTDSQWPERVSQINLHKYPLKHVQIQFENQPNPLPCMIDTPDRHYICSTQIQPKSPTEGQIQFKLSVDKEVKIYVIYLTTEPFIK